MSDISFAVCDIVVIIYADHSGDLSYIAISTLIGGVMGLIDGLYGELLEYIYDKNDSFDPWDVAICTVAGVAEGALVAIFPKNAYGISVGLNFAANLFDEGREYFIDKESLGSFISNLILGTSMDALFGLSKNNTIDETFVANMTSAFNNVYSEGVHPIIKSASNKTFKNGMKAAAKDQAHEVIEGIASGGCGYFVQWYVGTIFSAVFGW